jgi:hypothetical protein
MALRVNSTSITSPRGRPRAPSLARPQRLPHRLEQHSSSSGPIVRRYDVVLRSGYQHPRPRGRGSVEAESPSAEDPDAPCGVRPAGAGGDSPEFGGEGRHNGKSDTGPSSRPRTRLKPTPLRGPLVLSDLRTGSSFARATRSVGPNGCFAGKVSSGSTPPCPRRLAGPTLVPATGRPVRVRHARRRPARC